MVHPRENYLQVRTGDPVPVGPDGVRIGSETCSRLLPSIQAVRSLSQQQAPERLSLVTPVAGPEEIDDVLKTVTAAMTLGWGEVVVNDWGVLDEVSRGGGSGVTAGRLLMRFRRGPGSFDPWDTLDERTRRYFAWGPLYDSPFLAILKGKGVTRIELDPPRHWLPPPEVHGFRFSLHRDMRLISVSAACPWLYDAKKGSWSPMAGCRGACTGHRDIKMTSPGLKGPLLLRGRALYERVPGDVTRLGLPETVDRIILDGSLTRP